MVTSVKKSGISKRNKWIIGIAVGLILLIVMIFLFGTPSAESVFKDMNETMLQTKSVTVDQNLTMKSVDSGSAEINSKIFMNMESNKELLAKGDFSLDMTGSSTPMSISGEIIKIGENSYVKYSKISSTDSQIASSFTPIESKFKGNWIKVRDTDQFASFAKTPVEFLVSPLPTPFANLDSTQQKEILAIIQDKNMYVINESSKVETAGVSAYKYTLEYNKDQYKKMAKAIAGYASYFTASNDNESETTSLTVWVNINTKQIIKIDFQGTSSGADISGSIVFSDYNKTQIVEKPSEYFVESELLN